MVTETQPVARAQEADNLAVPAFVVGSAVARARRAMARSRRIPGLSLLFLGSLRGLTKTTMPRVPALPWSTGLSPALLWGWAARGNQAEGPIRPEAARDRPPAIAVPARLPAASASPDPLVQRKIDVGRGARDGGGRAPEPPAGARSLAEPLVGARAEPGALGPALTAKEARDPPGGRPIAVPDDRPHPLPIASGLEAVAPALVLVRSMLGAPTRAAVAGPSAEPARGEARRPDPGRWGFSLDVGAARPASARVEALAGASSTPFAVPVQAAPPREAAARGAAQPDVATGASATGAGATATGLSAAGRGRAPLRSGDELAAPDALPHRAPGLSRVEPTAAAAPVAPSTEGPAWLEPAADRPLPWADTRAGAAEAISRPAIVRPGIARPTDAGADALPALPERQANAAPAALRSVVDVTDTLRTFVAREVREVKDAVTRAAQRPPPPSPATDDEAARKLLSRMRTLMQEERFRSGKLR